MRGVRLSHVVVDDEESCSTLTLLQMVFNSTRSIEAEDDEVMSLGAKGAGGRSLGQSISLSPNVLMSRFCTEDDGGDNR